MWIALGMLLIAGWFVAKVVWNMASFAIHIALILGVVAVVAHFVRHKFTRSSNPTRASLH